jgi:hypothetical protein
MMRNVTISACFLTASVWCLAIVSHVNSAEPPTPESFKPVASVHALMEGQGMVFKELNAQFRNPNDPRRTNRIANAAELLAELANVNTLHGQKQDYVNWAKQLRDLSLDLSREAQKGQGAENARMEALLVRIQGTCQACHDVYQ